MPEEAGNVITRNAQLVLEDREELSFLHLLNTVLRHWKLLVVLPLMAVVAAVTLIFLQPVRFTAESTFAPATPSGSRSSEVANLAARAGFDLGGRPGAQSLDFYAQLLQSRELLQEAVNTRYKVTTPKGETRAGTLVELWEVEGKTPQRRDLRAVRGLQRQLSIGTDNAAGLVRLRTSSQWEDLAVQLNRRLLDLMVEFNLEKRQSQARAERAFVEERLSDLRAELAVAEGELQSFLQSNRMYQQSPSLAFEANRLQRDVDVKTQVVMTLSQAYEQARIEEIRSTPLVTILDAPEGSSRPAPKRLTLAGVFAAVFGFFLALVIAFGREALRHQRETDPRAYEEFVRLRQGVAGRLLPDGLRRRTEEPAGR